MMEDAAPVGVAECYTIDCSIKFSWPRVRSFDTRVETFSEEDYDSRS